MFLRKRDPKPTPPWMLWIVIGFVVFAVIHNQNEKGKVHRSLETASRNLDPNKLFPLGEYKKIFAYEEGLHIKDSKLGEGTPAICGQRATIAYDVFRADGSMIDDHATAQKPLQLHVGLTDAMPVFTKGLVGMQKGGVRSIVAPASMAYGIKEYAREDAAPDASVRFEIQLLDITPALSNLQESPYRIINVRSGSGAMIDCGKMAKLFVTMWSVDGKKIYAGKDKNTSVEFMPGQSEIALGIEQGAIGMFSGGARTLIIPPVFQKTMNGNTPAVVLPFPGNQTVLVDIEYAP